MYYTLAFDPCKFKMLIFRQFDVQLTRDLIPVLYHDLSLSESGTDVAIHDLTLKQVSDLFSFMSQALTYPVHPC